MKSKTLSQEKEQHFIHRQKYEKLISQNLKRFYSQNTKREKSDYSMKSSKRREKTIELFILSLITKPAFRPICMSAHP